MNNIFGEINNVKKYFENKNWIYEINDNGVRFYKNGTGLNDSKQIVDFSTKKSQCSFYESFDSFKSITIDYFSQVLSDLQILNPINIYSGYGQNSFVSTGLEYYYDYLYNGMVISRNNTMVIQPSVRFKLNFFNSAYGNNDVMDFSSIAFNNLSIVHFENELDRIVNIENVLSFLSRIGIHASRVNFVLEYKIRQKNNNVSYTAVKFFVDNLEIGDILFLDTNGIYLVEYGFGVERLFSRVLNKKYCDLFIENVKKYVNDEILAVNFLTLLNMFDNYNCNHGAKSKINFVLKTFNYNNVLLDLDLIFQNYEFWCKILEGTKYQVDFENVTQKYLKMVRRR